MQPPQFRLQALGGGVAPAPCDASRAHAAHCGGARMPSLHRWAHAMPLTNRPDALQARRCLQSSMQPYRQSILARPRKSPTNSNVESAERQQQNEAAYWAARGQRLQGYEERLAHALDPQPEDYAARQADIERYQEEHARAQAAERWGEGALLTS